MAINHRFGANAQRMEEMTIVYSPAPKALMAMVNQPLVALQGNGFTPPAMPERPANQSFQHIV
jgi:hypothetical protein